MTLAWFPDQVRISAELPGTAKYPLLAIFKNIWIRIKARIQRTRY